MKYSASSKIWFLRLVMAFLLSVSSHSYSQVEVESEQYRLSVGDILQVQVLGESELSMDIPVNETGVFIYPLLGQIELLDKTIVDIQTIITDGLRGDYLIDPQVNVNVIIAEVSVEELAADAPEGIYIEGQVSLTGQIAFQEGLTISKAIVLAGGFTERAARNKITVVSNEGEQKPRRVKLDYILKPGDIVKVPRRFF